MRIFLLFFILVVIVFFSLPFLNYDHVYGHAIPQYYPVNPDSNFDFFNFPQNITITFSERLDPKISYIHILNSNNQRIDNNDFFIGDNGKKATVTVDKLKIKEDVYSIVWAALSLDDGHISRGTYVINYGNQVIEKNNHGFEESFSLYYIVINGFLKYLIILSQVLIFGTLFVVIILLVGNNTLKNILEPDYLNMLHKLLLFTSFTMLLISLIKLIFDSYVLSSSIVSESSQILYTLLFDRIDNGYLIKISSMIALFITVVIGKKYIINDSLIITKNQTFSKQNTFAIPNKQNLIFCFMFILISVITIANSTQSHSASKFIPLLGIVIDWLHIAGISIWIGALILIFYVIVQNNKKIKLTIDSKGINKYTNHNPQDNIILMLITNIFVKLSSIIIIVVGLTGITGIILTWLNVPSFFYLFNTIYGVLLIIKILLIILLIYFGNKNNKYIKDLKTLVKNKTFENENKNKTRLFFLNRIHKNIKIEISVGLVVLLIGSLISIIPVQMALPIYDESSGKILKPAQEPPFELSLSSQNNLLKLTVFPFKVGTNQFNLVLTGPENHPIENISGVTAIFNNNEKEIGPIAGKFKQINNTNFSMNGSYLAQSGLWNLKIIVEREGAYNINFRTDLDLNVTNDSNDKKDLSALDSDRYGNIFEDNYMKFDYYDIFFIATLISIVVNTIIIFFKNKTTLTSLT
ncbi:MAG: hypothetical protein DA328_08490 [Nitrososphaeraceae archaeon]|nr:hypothetical protein [Nitrososphaeraceae archaeon]